jgi:hypothetical protein
VKESTKNDFEKEGEGENRNTTLRAAEANKTAKKISSAMVLPQFSPPFPTSFSFSILSWRRPS